MVYFAFVVLTFDFSLHVFLAYYHGNNGNDTISTNRDAPGIPG